MKLTKLLKAGDPITDRFMHSILDDSLLPNSIKKKAILYYRGDKRLSVPKFLDAITHTKTKSRVQIQKGGGWTFGVANAGYNVTAYNEDTDGKVQVVQRSDIPVFSPESPPVLPRGTSSINLGEALGSGNFATVYKITDEQEHVFKLFYKAPLQVLDTIQVNIESIKTKHPDVATVIPTPNPFVDNVSFPTEDEHGKPYSGRGYKMIKCDKSLKKALDESTDISDYVHKALGKLQTSFVHGDIKLDNIMLKHVGTEHIVHISDWDGVYMYDNALSSGPPPCVCFSPATAHPYYLWYVAMFKDNKSMNAETFALLDPNTNVTNVWNIFLKDGNATADMIKRIVNGLYGGGFAAHAAAHLKNPEWHLHMLERCDRYSLGMSLLLCAKQTGNRDMMSQGAKIISDACEIFPPGQSGGRRKSIRVGGEVPQTPTAMSTTIPAKPTEDLATSKKYEGKVASILGILDEYNFDDKYDVKTTGAIEKRTNNEDLEDLMKTHMFVPL